MKYQMDSLRHLLNGIEYLTVTSPDTGKIWLDRNLGASQVCTSSTDSSCYGNLYQWGRNDDGHESSSTTTVTRASNINPGYANFITQTDWTTVDSSGEDRSSALTDGGTNVMGTCIRNIIQLQSEIIPRV